VEFKKIPNGKNLQFHVENTTTKQQPKQKTEARKVLSHE